MGGIALATAMTVGAPASATDFLFSFKNVSTSNATYKDFSKTASDGTTLSVRASAWSLAGNTVYNAKLGGYAEGLGITSDLENGSSPQHTIDNDGEPEFILLQFSKSVLLNSITTSPFMGDSDATIGWGKSSQAWNSTLPLDGKSFNTLSMILTPLAGDGLPSTRNTGAKVTSNLWLVAAALKQPDGTFDGFKLGGISATTNPVPEPATWMMMILGFGLVGHAVRRRKAKRDTVAA